MTLLDEWMPTFDATSRHAIDVKAGAARTYAIARALDMNTPPLVRVLMGLRALPALAARAVSRRQRTPSGSASQVAVGGVPFTLLDEAPGSEFVMGLAGRFWTPSGGIVLVDAEAFRRPPPEGLAHATWNFRVEPRPHGCSVMTETRVRCADARTRAQFLRYWRVVRFGSGIIRRSILREVRQQAEHSE